MGAFLLTIILSTFSAQATPTFDQCKQKVVNASTGMALNCTNPAENTVNPSASRCLPLIESFMIDCTEPAFLSGLIRGEREELVGPLASGTVRQTLLQRVQAFATCGYYVKKISALSNAPAATDPDVVACKAKCSVTDDVKCDGGSMRASSINSSGGTPDPSGAGVPDPDPNADDSSVPDDVSADGTTDDGSTTDDTTGETPQDTTVADTNQQNQMLQGFGGAPVANVGDLGGRMTGVDFTGGPSASPGGYSEAVSSVGSNSLSGSAFASNPSIPIDDKLFEPLVYPGSGADPAKAQLSNVGAGGGGGGGIGGRGAGSPGRAGAPSAARRGYSSGADANRSSMSFYTGGGAKGGGSPAQKRAMASRSLQQSRNNRINRDNDPSASLLRMFGGAGAAAPQGDANTFNQPAPVCNRGQLKEVQSCADGDAIFCTMETHFQVNGDCY